MRAVAPVRTAGLFFLAIAAPALAQRGRPSPVHRALWRSRVLHRSPGTRRLTRLCRGHGALDAGDLRHDEFRRGRGARHRCDGHQALRRPRLADRHACHYRGASPGTQGHRPRDDLSRAAARPYRDRCRRTYPHARTPTCCCCPRIRWPTSATRARFAR
jgi:hypothetical protein